MKKIEWLGENPKGRHDRMSERKKSERLLFIFGGGDIRRGDIKRSGRSLWSDKKIDGVRIRIVLTLLRVWSLLIIVVIARSFSFVLPETFVG